MALLHKTDRYQSPNEKAARKHRDYGFILAVIGMAFALLVAKHSRQHPLTELYRPVVHNADVGEWR